jgi:hypothetical protein
MKKFHSMSWRMMTAEEYQAIKTKLGLGHEELAEMLDITARTSFHYAKNGAPRVVELAMRRLAETLPPKLKPEPKQKPKPKPRPKRKPRKAKSNETSMSVLPE